MLEDLKEILKDQSLHVFIGQIKRLHLAPNRSSLRVEVSVWPEERLIVCDMGWDSVGPESGFYNFPSVGDAVLGVSAEGDVDQSFIIKRLSSEEDKIPLRATEGHAVLKALAGKKIWNTSDTRLNFSRGDAEPTENLVIGQVFKATYIKHLNDLIDLIGKLSAQRSTDSTHTHLDVFGIPTMAPIQTAVMVSQKGLLDSLKQTVETLRTDDVDSEDILSDLSFTEK